MPLYNNVLTGINRKVTSDEDKLGYEFWNAVEELPIIKQIKDWNEAEARRSEYQAERNRSGQEGLLLQGLQGINDTLGTVVGLPFQALETGIDTISDRTGIDARTVRAVKDIVMYSKSARVSKSGKFYQGVQTTKSNIATGIGNWGKPASQQTIITKPITPDQGAATINKVWGLKRTKPPTALIPKYAQNAKIYLGDQPPASTFMTTTGGDQPNEFQQLVLKLEEEDNFPKLYNFPSNKPTPFVSKELGEELGPDGNKLEGLTFQEIQSIGRAAKTYELKRAYKDAATVAGYAKMTTEVEKAFINLLGDDFDRDLVRQYMLDVSKHETALKELQKITNDKTGKLWDVSHATALRNLEHSGRMLGNKGLFPAFNYEDTLDQTPLGRPIVKIEREGNRPDPTARGADFQRVLSRVLGKPLSLHESVLYWYDQNMFYFWKEASPLQRQQLVDSGRTRSGGRIKSELTVAENINQALESMKFGQETMSGKLGRPLTDEERLKALVDLATSELLKKRKYKRTNFKAIPRQGNVFYDIDTGETTDYSPDPGTGSSWDIEDPDPDNKYSK